MGLVRWTKYSSKAIFLILVFCFSLFSSRALANSTPYNVYPFFTVNGGDAFVGGWFNNGLTPCVNDTTSNNPVKYYQAPYYNGGTINNPYTASILSYASTENSQATGHVTLTTGSGSDFGAIALGLIDENSGSSYGFNTNYGDTTNRVPAKQSYLAFSNTNNYSLTNYGGGFFEGNVAQTHCIPDYYHTKFKAPKPWPGWPAVLSRKEDVVSQQYFLNTGNSPYDLLQGDTKEKLPGGLQLTLFVKGNVYIDGNISYGARGGYYTYNIPQFTLVVLGNIYVGPDAGRLMGWYIAQPDLTNDTTIANTGNFWTCHDNTNNQQSAAWILTNCQGGMEVDGGITAKQLNLTKLNDTVGYGNSISEQLNAIPEDYLSGPFFNQGSADPVKVNSIVSLPPIF